MYFILLNLAYYYFILIFVILFYFILIAAQVKLSQVIEGENNLFSNIIRVI